MNMPFPQGTVLVLAENGVPLYSARDLEQSLEAIKASRQARRTINGTLIDLSVDKFLKYESKIRCEDVEAPALDGVFPGQTLTVDCVAELVYKTVGGAPTREVVEGSERVVGAFTIYRPRLTMMVTKVEQRLSEYDHEVKWELELEEV